MDELVVEISDLRVRLAEAKGEKEELNGKLEVHGPGATEEMVD